MVEPDARRDRQAELWRDHYDAVLRYANTLVGAGDAPDLVAGAFERATRVDRPIDEFRRYLLRSVTNAAFEQSRSRRRRQARELKAAAASLVPAHESELDVRRAVAELSVQQRAVIYLTYWEDLDTNQIASLLEITTASVRRHLARARARLRKVLR